VTTETILGIKFFNGTVDEAVETMSTNGGLLVVPAAPALVKICEDEGYRRAVTSADMAIADSGAMVLIWRILTGRRVERISGLKFLKRLIARLASRADQRVLWIVPSERAHEKTIDWLRRVNLTGTADFYVAPRYGPEVRDDALLAKIDGGGSRGANSTAGGREPFASRPREAGNASPARTSVLVKTEPPAHVIVGIGGGVQEKLGLFLKENLRARPAIHCIGAALAFLTGDQPPIPMWADTFYLGWLLRLLRQPRIFGPRYLSAFRLPALIFRYKAALPPLREKSEMLKSGNAEKLK
jgi:UDP-N-acetyl-D-mannosaminuronic acid transferase (WecB/TagA/CpsF family)